MNIQSFSIAIPANTCINTCPFCVSRMINSNVYPNLMDINHPHFDINISEYLKRMKYVADTGCKTLMLTGTCEPQQNKQFLEIFALLHRNLGTPFSNIEMQTTGILLDNRNYLRFLRNFIGVNTIALSINSPNSSENSKIIGHPFNTQLSIDFPKLISLLKEYDFNIRLCFNLNKYFKFDNCKEFFDTCKQKWFADQITFRKLYTTDINTTQDIWIKNNLISEKDHNNLISYLKEFPSIGKTIYGAEIRRINDMSVIYDDDCMAKKPIDNTVKYLILRPNCKLYSSWDSKASLVF